MWTTNDQAAASDASVDPAHWQGAFEGLTGRIAGRFKQVEPRRRVRQLVLGLLSDLPRKNCWTIAEWAGEAAPDGMQHLLRRAKWDADAVRDDVRGYVVKHLHDHQAVLVVDETGSGKGLAGLDEHQVRRYASWSRWVTLAMLAHAFLAVVRANELAHHPTPDDLIPLTCNEIRRLFTALIAPLVRTAAQFHRWSEWRRRHQARSRASHYKRQAAQP